MGLRRVSSDQDMSVKSNSGEHMAITPDEYGTIPHEGVGTNQSGTFVCTFCPFKTFQKNVYDTHLRRHSSEKTFFCQFCSYSCMTKSNLKCHIRKHTGEKPFGCPYCNYRSAQSSNIKIHVRRMHKGANPSPEVGASHATHMWFVMRIRYAFFYSWVMKLVWLGSVIRGSWTLHRILYTIVPKITFKRQLKITLQLCAFFFLFSWLCASKTIL